MMLDILVFIGGAGQDTYFHLLVHRQVDTFQYMVISVFLCRMYLYVVYVYTVHVYLHFCNAQHVPVVL